MKTAYWSFFFFLSFQTAAKELLLPFGLDHKDVRMEKGDEICSPIVDFQGHTFNFYSEEYEALRVCTNGFLSFNEVINDLLGLEHLASFPIAGISLLTPFWADISTEDTEPDLANEIFYRFENRSFILREIDSIMMSKSSFPEFRASWAFVATWNRVKYYDQISPERNTFQCVITCDSVDTSSCFGIFSYKELQWTSDGYNGDAAAGWNDGFGRSFEVPLSRLPEVRNLPIRTNIALPGIFLFHLSEASTPSETQKFCTPDISPETAYMFTEPTPFQLSGFYCDGSPLQSEDDVEVLFSGERYQVRFPVTASPDRLSITGSFPFWGRSEDVKVYVVINKEPNPRGTILKFFSREQKFSMHDVIDISKVDEDSSEVTFEWDKHFFQGSISLVPVLLLVTDAQETNSLNPFTVNLDKMVPIENSGEYTISIRKNGFTFLQLFSEDANLECMVSQSSLSLTPCVNNFLTSVIPVLPNTVASCNLWVRDEASFVPDDDLEKWYDPLSLYYGCPRKPRNPRNIFANEIILNTDAYFAHEEVKMDAKGWKYDPCCSEKENKMKVMGFCSNCEFNEGASFCIVSPSIEIAGWKNDRRFVHATSNQCCYNEAGHLITDKFTGAGRVSKEHNSPYNALAHYKSDIAPYKGCCLGRKSSQKSCNQYHENRPVITGRYYVPSYITMTIVQRDPHFRTLDGFRYTFNGLGVYTLVALNDSSSTHLEVQVSMRRIGDGTVLSGFVLKDGKATIEGYLPPKTNELQVKVNKQAFQLHEFREVRLSGIEIRETSPNEFTFMSQESNLAVKVMITDSSILNVATIPPLTLMDDLIGLLGNFDGNSTNDLCSKNGTLLSSETEMIEIHHMFGESWKVDEDKWFFSLDFARNIHTDIRSGLPYNAVYKPTFENTEQEQRIREACDGDETCILDVSLTKDFAFANTTKVIKNVTEIVEVIAQEYEEERKTVEEEIRQRKEEIKTADKKYPEADISIFKKIINWFTD